MFTDSDLVKGAGPEATEQKSQDTWLATTCLGPVDLGGGAWSQGVLRMRPAEFIRLNRLILV